MSTLGMRRSRHLGDHQARALSRLITAGISVMRIRKASMRMRVARATRSTGDRAVVEGEAGEDAAHQCRDSETRPSGERQQEPTMTLSDTSTERRAISTSTIARSTIPASYGINALSIRSASGRRRPTKL
jgi:hypothetical protein